MTNSEEAKEIGIRPKTPTIEERLKSAGLTDEESYILIQGFYAINLTPYMLSYAELDVLSQGQIPFSIPLQGMTAEQNLAVMVQLAKLGIGLRRLTDTEIAGMIRRQEMPIFPTHQATSVMLVDVLAKLLTGKGLPRLGMREQVLNLPPAANTIDLPGLLDVVIVPWAPRAYEQHKKELTDRMKTKVTQVPKSLQWIPGTINMIDDANDLIITFGYPLKALLKKVIPAAIPGINIALYAATAMDVANGLLSMPLTGPVRKGKVFTQLGHYARGLRKVKVTRIPEKRFPGWGGYLAQALQSMRTLTGYGLQLGTIFGAMSDSFWTAIKDPLLRHTVIRGPTPSDPLSKACRFLMGAPSLEVVPWQMGQKDFIAIVGAYLAAAHAVKTYGVPKGYEDTIKDLLTMPCPRLAPWQVASIKVLQERAIDPLSVEALSRLLNDKVKTIKDQLETSRRRQELFLAEMRRTVVDPAVWAMLIGMLREADGLIIDTLTGEDDSSALVPEMDIQIALKLMDLGLVPVRDYYTPNRADIDSLKKRIKELWPEGLKTDTDIKEAAEIISRRDPRVILTRTVLEELCAESAIKLPYEAIGYMMQNSARIWGQNTINNPGKLTKLSLKFFFTEIEKEMAKTMQTIPSIENIRNAAARQRVYLLSTTGPVPVR